MPDELKPCPFCGQQPKIYPANLYVEGDSWTAIECANCITNPPNTQSVVMVTHYADSGHFESAIAAWNQRITPATDSTELEARLRMHQSWRDSHGELNDAPNEAADTLASYRAEIAQLRDKLARANHTAADLLQHVDWLTCGLPDMLENAALTDEEGLIGAAIDAATSARQALKDTAHD